MAHKDEEDERLATKNEEWKRIRSNGIYGLDDGASVLSINESCTVAHQDEKICT